MQRTTRFLLLTGAISFLWSAATPGGTLPRYRSSDPNRVPDAPWIDRTGIEPGQSKGVRWTSRPAYPAGRAPSASPGLQVGLTAFDVQQNGSTGRQIDKFGDRLQCTWTQNDQFSISNGRTVFWNRADVMGSPTAVALDDGRLLEVLPLGNTGSALGQVAFSTGDRPGFTTFRNLPTGRGVAFMHDAPLNGDPVFWLAALDAAAGVGVFIPSPAPQPAGTALGEELLWPHGTTDVVASDTILHAVAWGRAEQPANPAYYWRGRLTGTTTVSWSPPIYLDSLTSMSCIVEQDPNSDKVAVVYTKPRSLASQINNDVAYFESTDGGLSWNGPFNVTQYTDSSLDRAFCDVAALYDQDGTLHIAYNTFDYRPGEGTFFSPCDLWHWNDVRQTSRVINTVDLGEIGNSCSEIAAFNGGVWNLLMAKQNLIVKPAGVNGIAEELLYAVWVQFGPALDTIIIGPDTLVGDCATQDSAGTKGGMVNGEIWLSTSSNDGLTWDRPLNITGTRTPDCLPGDCHSEHWVSAARIADSGIYVSYLDDSHAGAAVRAEPSEGVWSYSPYRVLAVKARTPVLEPRLSVGPTTFQELNVTPGGTNSQTMTVRNLGNAPLTFTIIVTGDGGGSGHVLVNGGGTYSSTIPAAGAPDVISIEFDGIGLPNPSEHDWRLTLTSNDTGNDPGQGGTAIDIDLNVFVADPWFACARDTVSTGQHRLAVGSCLELGDRGIGGGLYNYANGSEWIFDASPVIARLDGPIKRAYRDIHWNSLSDRSRDSNRAFRAQSAITVSRHTTVNGKPADQASGVATTTDSLIQIDWTVTAFRETGLTHGAVARYRITNRTVTTFSGLILGGAAELDVDSLAGDNVGIADETAEYVGARGGFRDTSGALFTPQNNFAALFNVRTNGTCSDVAAGGQALDNRYYISSAGAYDTDTLYDLMSRMVGWNASTLPADTITDVSTIIVASQGNVLSPSDTLEFAIGLAVSDISQSDMKSTIARLQAAVNDACLDACPITLTGDVNLTGTITSADIIGLVNFVFKGGSAPLPCAAAGDVNCTGTVTSADIIGLVNFVFKGGGPPCDACSSALATGC